jgi:hypothetical protein
VTSKRARHQEQQQPRARPAAVGEDEPQDVDRADDVGRRLAHDHEAEQLRDIAVAQHEERTGDGERDERRERG